MIKTSELRQGNLIHDGERPLIVVDIKRGYIYGETIPGTIHNAGITKIEKIYGVPLTEHNLLNFGAVKTRRGLRITIGHHEFHWHRQGDFINYWKITSHLYFNRPEYVHTFQNFVFALSGQELPIKL